MLKYKEPFICGLNGTHQVIGNFQTVLMVNVEIGFFMMQKPDEKSIIYQNSLGEYRETTEKNIIRLKEKNLIQNLEHQITERYVPMEKRIKNEKEKYQIIIDELIGKKGNLLMQLSDLIRKGEEELLTENQLKSYREIEKAIKRVTRKLFRNENKVTELELQLELLDTGKFTSIQNMKRLMKSIKA